MKYSPLKLAIYLLPVLCACDMPNKEYSAKPTALKTEIRKEDGRYQLFRDGAPYQIRGAGLEFGDIRILTSHGGNSFRTWRTDNGKETGQQVLDKAFNNGCSVTMCLELERERHGFNYDDPKAVEKQFKRMKSEVLKYKDHPALIIWAIGNELNLGYSNPKVYDAVNEISKMIHEIDPYHLTTTTTAGINPQLIDDIKSRAPDIDLLSIQMYGDIVNLPKYIQETGWEKPYMVTEWGATGHWEVDTTQWGAPIEQNSSIKAKNYLERYQLAIAPYHDQCVGSYVFLWGQKQERTPTWYGMFLESGEKTEAIDVMHKIWNGNWPQNRAPGVDSVKLAGRSAYDNIYVVAGRAYDAKASISDPDNDSLNYLWEVKPESTEVKEGGDFEASPESIPGLINDPSKSEISFKAPDESGPYRLFVYAYDGNGHAAHANIPFFVSD